MNAKLARATRAFAFIAFHTIVTTAWLLPILFGLGFIHPWLGFAGLLLVIAAGEAVIFHNAVPLPPGRFDAPLLYLGAKITAPGRWLATRVWPTAAMEFPW